MRRSKPVDPNGDRRGAYQGYRLNPSATGGGLKIGRCLAIGKAICCPGRTTAISRPWSERHTRYVMLAKVAGKDTRTVVTALIKASEEATKGAV